ncbi:DUF697 domain-containing protein [Azospirillum cavernae]|uniref:DUF697 domain-containing protein n=1 Tax=Azospirillum cavernae TaxID=2320860 RepID=A0A418VT78_9PROT|nr:DUF697 domain-containing protein [Azospirillum cavernae]RJF79676.1 DUF697 domain-containing protein [Azospirillum cavernae]
MVIKKDPPTGDGAPPFTPDPVVEAAAAPTTPFVTDSAAETASEAAPEAAALDAAPEAVASEATVESERERHAHTIIRNHVLLSAAAGVIPVAFVDTAAVAVVQLRLLKELSDVYGVSFRADIGRSAVGTLLASVTPALLGGGILGSAAVNAALRSVPVVGTVTRFATQPLFNAAFTYALGKVFQQHFASGGTFLTFDPEKVKTYFREKYDELRRRKGVVPDAVPDAVAA